MSESKDQPIDVHQVTPDPEQSPAPAPPPPIHGEKKPKALPEDLDPPRKTGETGPMKVGVSTGRG